MEKLNWTKKGQILSLASHGGGNWMHSHAQNPATVVFDDFIRVYFNTRPVAENDNHVSYPTYVDLDKEDPRTILRTAHKPVLSLGEIGCFDQFGCMSSSIIRHDDELWMYYVGWSRGVAVPYNWAIGLAVSSDDGKRFKRAFSGPVLGAQYNEPYLQNGQYVLREGSNRWHMWYSTGKKWLEHDGKLESVYVIVYAQSEDGIHWNRNGNAIIPFSFENETQTTPTVFRKNGKFHMIFSSRHSTDFRNADRGYRLGYAWSEDMITWQRDDSAVGIDPSSDGWDSEMVCYPHVVQVGDRIFLFYCGNNFGEDGFGCALLD